MKKVLLVIPLIVLLVTSESRAQTTQMFAFPQSPDDTSRSRASRPEVDPLIDSLGPDVWAQIREVSDEGRLYTYKSSQKGFNADCHSTVVVLFDRQRIRKALQFDELQNDWSIYLRDSNFLKSVLQVQEEYRKASIEEKTKEASKCLDKIRHIEDMVFNGRNRVEVSVSADIRGSAMRYATPVDTVQVRQERDSLMHAIKSPDQARDTLSDLNESQRWAIVLSQSRTLDRIRDLELQLSLQRQTSVNSANQHVDETGNLTWGPLEYRVGVSHSDFRVLAFEDALPDVQIELRDLGVRCVDPPDTVKITVSRLGVGWTRSCYWLLRVKDVAYRASIVSLTTMSIIRFYNGWRSSTQNNGIPAIGMSLAFGGGWRHHFVDFVGPEFALNVSAIKFDDDPKYGLGAGLLVYGFNRRFVLGVGSRIGQTKHSWYWSVGFGFIDIFKNLGLFGNSNSGQPPATN